MISALIAAAILLAIGLAARLRIGWLAALYIPASVIAGFAGLLLLQSARWVAPLQTVVEPLARQWRTWPGFLIAVVFAGLLLKQPAKSSAAGALRRAGREGLMVWIIVLGQTAVGLMVTWLIVQPIADVPDAFGMLIETGFAGGHGTAAAMGEVFARPAIGLDVGLDLGLLMATAGLVYGILSGVVWVNLGVRLGWTRRREGVAAVSPLGADDQDQDLPAEPIGHAVVRGDVLDPLLVQVVWIALAVGIGYGLRACVTWPFAGETIPPTAGDPLADRTGAVAILGSFPLFIYTLFGGWIVRKTLSAWGGGHLIDSASIERLTSTAMDVLVVAAIASLDLVAVGGRIVEWSILLAAAAIWTGFCLAYLSRRILPADRWFELGLINYGMSTGTTATGFVLVKLIDPKLRSGAAEDYALAAPLSSPFVGGGMITIGLPILVLGVVPLGVVATALTAAVAFLIGVAMRWGSENRGP